jgi:hypothetical protein
MWSKLSIVIANQAAASTSNTQHPAFNLHNAVWTLSVKRWMLDVEINLQAHFEEVAP